MTISERQERRVTVSLVGGDLDGCLADAPRDSEGRILAEIWVEVGPHSGSVVASAKRSSSQSAEIQAHYRLANWRGTDPEYEYECAAVSDPAVISRPTVRPASVA